MQLGGSPRYSMFVRHVTEPLLVEKQWMRSSVLLSRPIEKRMDGMSISFPGGDSVMLGLHDLTRGGAADAGKTANAPYPLNPPLSRGEATATKSKPTTS